MSIRTEDIVALDFADIADTAAARLPPTHPGIILLEDWLKPMSISQYALAKAIGVPPRRINEIVHGLRGITVDTALRLAAFFGTDAQSWVNLQTHYDTELAREAMHSTLQRIPRYDFAAATPPN